MTIEAVLVGAAAPAKVGTVGHSVHADCVRQWTVNCLAFAVQKTETKIIKKRSLQRKYLRTTNGNLLWVMSEGTSSSFAFSLLAEIPAKSASARETKVSISRKFLSFLVGQNFLRHDRLANEVET